MAKNKNHHLRKRGDVWYLVSMVKEKRFRKALCESVIEARRMRDQFLREIDQYGEIQKNEYINENNLLFGGLSQKWVKIKSKII